MEQHQNTVKDQTKIIKLLN
jgi:hypothetical protein